MKTKKIFIRTKDGRIITFAPKDKYENDKVTFDWFVANYCGGGINVLKIADILEELCDCKVYIPKNKNETPYLEYPCRKYDYVNERYEIVYGAIWTDKGLIYVAKMNDEGELELL